MPAPVLELEGVTKLYGEFCAVDDLSFSVPTGQVLGFLGQNGAGKTTTLRMILDIVRPTRGRITVLGAGSALAVRHRIGYLPEEKGLYRKMKAWALIAHFGALKGLDLRTARDRAFELLERHGLGAFAQSRAEQLSKGMGQKVQVLASIAHDPELVILDEPFSGLDPVNQGVLEGVIADLKARGRTVIFSTHIMQHAERLCDRLILIAHGRKRFDGTLEDARRTQPVRVRLQTADDVAPLRQLPGVRHSAALGEGEWELELGEGVDAQPVLEACFAHRIRLRRFNTIEPTLHDLFVRLVGEAPVMADATAE